MQIHRSFKTIGDTNIMKIVQCRKFRAVCQREECKSNETKQFSRDVSVNLFDSSTVKLEFIVTFNGVYTVPTLQRIKEL